MKNLILPLVFRQTSPEMRAVKPFIARCSLLVALLACLLASLLCLAWRRPLLGLNRHVWHTFYFSFFLFWALIKHTFLEDTLSSVFSYFYELLFWKNKETTHGEPTKGGSDGEEPPDGWMVPLLPHPHIGGGHPLQSRAHFHTDAPFPSKVIPR